MSGLCPYGHIEKNATTGGWKRGENYTLGTVFLANGVVQIKAVCCNCGEKSGSLPQHVITQLGVDPLTLPVLADHRDHTAVCSVRGCARIDTEWHHFAPYNVFTVEADDWPCLLLCRQHHREWHTRMDGYRWHKAGEWAS